jgi:xanthine dehydrogenase/oxidase
MYGSGMPHRPTAEPIFPPELRKRIAAELHLPGKHATWHRPTSLASLLALKAEHPEAKLVVGNTEVGIEMKFKAMMYPHLIGTTHVPELNQIEVLEEGLRVGASVPLTTLLKTLRDQIASQPAHKTSTFHAVVEQLRWFAGVQIRNTASLGGNIVTGSPISDLNPLWMVACATFTTAGQGTEPRTLPARTFFLGYRKVDLQPHEVLTSVFIPFTAKNEYVKEFKQAHRRDDDIAIVNAGMRVRMGKDSSGAWVAEEVELAFGGVAPKAITAPQTEAVLKGKPWDQGLLTAALEALATDVNITPNAPGGMVEFRRSLAASFLFRFVVHANYALAADEESFTPAFPESFASANVTYERAPCRGLQYFSSVPDEDVVGKPYRHQAADMQVTGEAVYVDDMPLPANALHAVLVLSTRPHAKLLRVDASKALEAEGVVGYFDHRDVPGDNHIGAVAHDEEVFVTSEVTCVGQPIGVIVAETEQQARLAVRLMEVDYEDLPAVLSCADAIEANSYFEGWGHRIDCGDVEAALASGCDHVLEGEGRVGGQEHFYLEPHCSIVIPKEHDEFEAWASTQAPTKHQVTLHGVLGVPMHKIVSRVKRIGGGFGGKETRSAFVQAAIAVPAYHTRRPVRIVLDRDEDMQITGQRHAFYAKYKVGFTREGILRGLDVDLYCNAGCSLDLSSSIMDRALLHTDNAYRLGAVRAVGHLCKTNMASNTAFRGFGGPQGMMFTEMWVDRIARTLGMTPEAVRTANMYAERDRTHYGQELEACQVRPCWEQVLESSAFEARLAAAGEWNAKNRWRKRGLAALPTKFGISFTTKFLNQAGALVHIYTDGTVLVTHGGVEMGQGLHTKIAQIAAHDLCVPLNSVYIAETATDKVPNSSPTAASASSDMYGGATADACAQLNARLAPYREKLAGKSFAEIVMAAHLERVDLSAHGFYSTPDVTGFGGDRPFNYFTFGAAVAEVELDCLTGDFQILRTDICMDLGKSINPTIDIGQVEGGFVQGLGWTCIEELVWGDKEHQWVRPGTLHTRGPGTYKIPTANDIPMDFRVTLLKDAPCHRTPLAHSSKAIGEPPFFLGASVFFALKEAVYAARAEAGETGYFQLDSPATPEKLRMACADHLTAPFAGPDLRCKMSC